MEVPKSWRPAMHKTAMAIHSPVWAFFIWIILSLFLLPCTSGPYVLLISYIASKNSDINSIVLLYVIIYNLIFVLPMIAITFIVWLGYEKVEKLNKLRTKNIRILHLIIWLLMLLLGLFIIHEAFQIY